MAKVLSIGAKYIPNMKAGVDQNGKTIFSPTVFIILYPPIDVPKVIINEHIIISQNGI